MPTSPLQSQYPLSPRKFWKKLLSATLLWVFLTAVMSPLFFLIIAVGLKLSAFACLTLLIAFLVLILGIYALYVRAYIRRYYYDATDAYITIKKGVFAPTEIHVQYSKIQDVYVDQDILDRLMGLYDVHVASATATSGIEAHIDGVDEAAADGLKHLLLSKLGSGGAPTSAASFPAPSNIPSSASSTPINDVSSQTYPITGGWVFLKVINGFFFSAFIGTWIVVSVALPGKNGSASLATDFGWGTNTFWGIGLIAFVIIYAVYMAYSLLWKSTYSFALLSDYLIMKQGVIAKKENHLPYRSIQDVVISQGIIERMLGIATVRIENAAAMQMVGKRAVSSAILIPGQPLVKANGLSDVLKDIALTKNSSQTGL
jgi:putative membrane protein